MKCCINDNEVKIGKAINMSCRNCLLEEKSEYVCDELNICTLNSIIVNSENTSPIFYII